MELEERAAVWLLASEECNEGEKPKAFVGHWSNVMDKEKDGEHFGDCTNVACSCTRCILDDAKFRAAAVMAAIRETHAIVPREPTEAMVIAALSKTTYNIETEMAEEFITPYAAQTAYTAMIEAAEGNG